MTAIRSFRNHNLSILDFLSFLPFSHVEKAHLMQENFTVLLNSAILPNTENTHQERHLVIQLSSSRNPASTDLYQYIPRAEYTTSSQIQIIVLVILTQTNRIDNQIPDIFT